MELGYLQQVLKLVGKVFEERETYITSKILSQIVYCKLNNGNYAMEKLGIPPSPSYQG